MKRIAVSVLLTPDPDSDQMLLVKRNPRLRFFGGYLAFPGGVLEEQDRTLSCQHLSEVEGDVDAGFEEFIACAARELFEEVGVWLPRGPAIEEGRLRAFRKQLLSGEVVFKSILDAENQVIDARDFTPICRITTPPFGPARYDTWFVRCRMPEAAQVDVWKGELEEGEFLRAGEALDRWRNGGDLIVPPVLILLEELQGQNSQSFLPAVRQLTESYDRGKLHRVFFTPGVLLAPLKTQPRPPATHTNAVVVGDQDLYVIDPACSDPDEQAKLWELLDELQSERRRLRGILLTHYHPDHVGAVAICSERYKIPIMGHRETAFRLPHLKFERLIQDGDRLELGSSPDGRPNWQIEVIDSPGHAPGHLAFRENRYYGLIVGDAISTLSSILVDPSEGDLIAYMRSLERLAELALGTVYPSHGPPARDGRRAIQKQIEHREERENQLLQALSPDPQAPATLVAQIYQDIDQGLWPLAERSLLSGLLKLEAEKRVGRSSGGFFLNS